MRIVCRLMAVAGLCLAAMGLHAYEVSVDTVVANPDQRIAVPVRVDTVKGASYAGVNVSYDPQVLVFVKAEEGPLTATLSDDYLVWTDEKGGTVSVTAFAGNDVTEDVGGVLSTLIFKVREGTQGLYSDLAVSEVQIGERTGVKDLAIGNPIVTKNGMVRVLARTASASRLENAQVICADAVLGGAAFRIGDGIQASNDQTPVVIDGETSAEGGIDVLPPSEGWASGRYALLKTRAGNLELSILGADGIEVSQEKTSEDGFTTYFATLKVAGEIEVVCTDETLSAGARNMIREAIEKAGTMLEGVREIAVKGPEGNISLIADLGIAPAIAPAVDELGTLEVTYSMPTITITSFDPETGVVKIKVVPGEGNTIISELATGYLHVYGTSNLAEKMERIAKVGFDLTPYLKHETKGEAVLTVELGTSSFLQIRVEELRLID